MLTRNFFFEMVELCSVARSWDSGALHQRFAAALAAAGLDVCVPFNLQRYNETAPECSRISTASLCRGGRTLGILFGNSKVMWPKFLEACRNDPALLEAAHPLDGYVKRAVSGAAESVVGSSERVKFYWGNDKHEDLEGGTGYVSVQALAAGLGICYLDKNSHLCIHPKYGSWFSLRGFLLVDGMECSQTDYQALPNPLSPEQEAKVAAALQQALYPHAESRGGAGAGATYKGVRDQWRRWLAVRTSLHGSEPHPWQYDEQQTVYHYTSNRDLLKECVSSAAAASGLKG